MAYRAVEVGQTLEESALVTTESVLTELLNFFGEYGPSFRLRTGHLVQTLLEREDLEVVEQTHAAFRAGVELRGFDMGKGEIRGFRMDRVALAKVTDRTYVPRWVVEI